MFKKITAVFLVWRIGLFLITFLAVSFIPQFGGRFPYYDTILIPTGLPSWIWGFGNFDGVHYLRIAMLGYEGSNLSQAFFPLYPILIKIFAFNNQWFISGFLIANIFLLISLLIFYKLLKLDFSEKIAWRSALLLLVFPTSFYLGAVYSESLFIFLTLISIYFLRKRNYLGAGIFGGMATATRLVGLMLLPLFILEVYENRKRLRKVSKTEVLRWLTGGGLMVSGFLAYMYLLQVRFGNPLYFLSAPSQFGTGRESLPLVLLPQVLFRYLKIVLTTSVISLPFLNAVLEVIFTVVPLILLLIFFKKMRLSYWIFTAACLLIPTLTGTLTSMPRYALMSFLIFPLIIEKLGKSFNIAVLTLALLGVVLLSLFVRGYWIA